MKGWQCPKCDNVYGPHVDECVNCNGGVRFVPYPVYPLPAPSPYPYPYPNTADPTWIPPIPVTREEPYNKFVVDTNPTPVMT